MCKLQYFFKVVVIKGNNIDSNTCDSINSSNGYSMFTDLYCGIINVCIDIIWFCTFYF